MLSFVYPLYILSISVDLHLIERPFANGNDGTSRALKRLKDIVSQQ